MSTVTTIAKLATGAVGKAVHAATHPVRTVATVTGQARELASTVTGHRGSEPSAAPSEDPRPAGRAGAPDEPATVLEVDLAEPFPEAPEPEPTRSVEPSTTEPKAASRDSAHAGRGEDPSDDWHDELDDGTEVETAAGIPGAAPEINPATGQPHRPVGGDEPLLDPAVAKAVRTEAETMRKAAESAGE